MFFASFVFPPVLGYLIIAVLAVTPKTHVLRMALWPAVALLALRATFSVDMSPGEPVRKSCNVLFIVSVSFMIVRTFEWTLTKGPLVRHLRHSKGSRPIVENSLDLATTLRGDGWDWSHGVHIPRETRPTNRARFTLYVTLSAALHALLCVVLYIAVRSFSPTGLGAPCGGSIFDGTLPFASRYLRASVISTVAAPVIYATIQAFYDVCTVFGVLVLGQDLPQWPPAFDVPWCATSVGDFWGRRWHQFFRRTFLMLGGLPLSRLLGTIGTGAGIAGRVVGSFLASGVLHHAIVRLLGDNECNHERDPVELWRLVLGFGGMGLVVLAERAFRRVTGRRVGGLVGWVWTMSWVLVLGNVIIDAFARGGAFGHFAFLEGMITPDSGRKAVQRVVVDLDAWLRHGRFSY